MDSLIHLISLQGDLIIKAMGMGLEVSLFVFYLHFLPSKPMMSFNYCAQSLETFKDLIQETANVNLDVCLHPQYGVKFISTCIFICFLLESKYMLSCDQQPYVHYAYLPEGRAS